MGVTRRFYSSDYYSMNGIENTKEEMPILKTDERLYVYLQGNHFQKNNVLRSSNDHVINKNVVNIYIVYKLDLLASTRDKSFTIQNALIGAMQITKNATDNSKNNYKGYGICFDERSEFGHTITEGGHDHTTDARNVLIFGADMSFSVHATNKANHIYLMGTGLTQGINDNNGDNSYLFVNGRQELKFKAKTDHLVKEKLCIGNLSDQWTTSETEKTGVYGKIYDFVMDYKQISGVKAFYDMHRYLITKHNINPQRTYKMWLINLTISLFSILKVRALECVSVVNQKCMPRPKILDVNEGAGEALFYSYNPIEKLCVPNVIKILNMKVYNFLTMLNESRNVLWHESCKCVCKLNSSVSNNKQIWNSNTRRCDYNEDFAGMINCVKGYTWNPSTCKCQCDMWCKPGQYLDHKNCVCKNKSVGRLTEECTSVINETMINNKDSSNNNTLCNVFICLFSVLLLVGVICFCVFA